MIQNNNKAKPEEKEENLEGERANVDHKGPVVRMRRAGQGQEFLQNIS